MDQKLSLDDLRLLREGPDKDMEITRIVRALRSYYGHLDGAITQRNTSGPPSDDVMKLARAFAALAQSVAYLHEFDVGTMDPRLTVLGYRLSVSRIYKDLRSTRWRSAAEAALKSVMPHRKAAKVLKLDRKAGAAKFLVWAETCGRVIVPGRELLRAIRAPKQSVDPFCGARQASVQYGLKADLPSVSPAQIADSIERRGSPIELSERQLERYLAPEQWGDSAELRRVWHRS